MNRLRLPRVIANGIYDTNEPQSYFSTSTASSESSGLVMGLVANGGVRGEEEENLRAINTPRDIFDSFAKQPNYESEHQ